MRKNLPEKINPAIIEFGCKIIDCERVSVQDNGVGFSMECAGKLFAPFQRPHSVNDYEGTGIGLANVNRVVQSHNGKIWAEAEVNKGATFYFTLNGELLLSFNNFVKK